MKFSEIPKGAHTQKKFIKRYGSEMGSEILTNFNIILLLKDGFYHLNLSLKFYA